MAERPLLLFPQPEPASRSSLPNGRNIYRIPSHDRQGARLLPMGWAINLHHHKRWRQHGGRYEMGA